MKFLSKLFNRKKTSEMVSIYSPAIGNIESLSSLGDGVFSEGILGKGTTIKPTQGKIYAPFDGLISTVFHTKHAYGIEHPNGFNVLIHIGVDTVQLNGKGFTSKVIAGQAIKKGDLIATIDLDFVKSKKLKDNVIIVIPPEYNKTPVEQLSHGKVDNDTLILIVDK